MTSTRIPRTRFQHNNTHGQTQPGKNTIGEQTGQWVREGRGEMKGRGGRWIG